ncbi:hypothetical protein CPI83_29075 (plasmid) [Rhodococcus sp. H-CA8f]|nr:hypothetical protein CPI83_29075 [Rhodococcus sp. H-CA8f]
MHATKWLIDSTATLAFAEVSGTAAEHVALAAKAVEEARSRKTASTESELAKLLVVVHDLPAVKEQFKSVPDGVELPCFVRT